MTSVFAAGFFRFGFRGAWPYANVPTEKEDGEEGKQDEGNCDSNGEFCVVREAGGRGWSGSGGAVGID